MPGAIPHPYTMNSKLDSLASIGVVALATDATLEREWRMLLDIPGVGFYVGRVPNAPTINREGLTAMADRLDGALGALLPDNTLDCIVYACTSASMFIGEERVASIIRTARPAVEVTNPLTAVKAALSSLGARRVAVLTPYIDEVNAPLAEALGESGTDVVAMGSFFNSSDPEVVRIDRASIRNACLKLAGETRADALFVACTALGASDLVEELEAETGLRVTTSNHAMAWHALRLCGVEHSLEQRGGLFRLPIVESGDRREAG